MTLIMDAYTAYTVLFWDSFRSMFSLYLSSETSWFAARDFGLYNIAVITAICFTGAVLGAFSSAAAGYAVSFLKDRVFTLDDELYANLRSNASKYGIYIFLFQMLPFIKLFFFFAGLLRLPLRRLVIATLAGRALYYLYYLYIPPIIPLT